MNMRGKFVVLDGADGVGKDTQADRLLAAAHQQGISAALIRYPGYERTLTGKVVQSYLRGEYGELDTVHPKIATYLFATDRFELKAELEQLLATHDLVIASRYAASNLAFQTARVPEVERPAFRDWVLQLEYGTFSAIKEDAVIFLSLPTALSEKLIAKRQQAAAVQSRDIYDEHKAFQLTVLEQYHILCSMFDHWRKIECEQGDDIRSIEDIGAEIQQLVFEQILAPVEVA